MKEKNVFYIKNIVDREITDDNTMVQTKRIVMKIQNDITILSDDDFIEVMISCFIPDTYKDQGKKEKLYTKLSELVVGEWWRRMGGTYILPTKKSGTEDVEMILSDKSIVCDSKIFRLGRSQKAPNVKDFLKLASVETWIINLQKKYMSNETVQDVIGGLVTYSSFHEWESDSEVYLECSNPKTSVIMLPYEVLALLLKHRLTFKLSDLLDLWDYKKIGMRESKAKKYYWDTVKSFLFTLLKFNEEQYQNEIKEFQNKIIEAKDKYKKLILEDMKNKHDAIENKINAFTCIEELKKYSIETISSYKNAKNIDYLKRISTFRNY